MSDLKRKPAAFVPGSRTLSAGALNLILTATPRLITGGAGIGVGKMGDRIIVSRADPAGAPPGTAALVTVKEVKGTYLVCDRDGATINVAKPWGLRHDAQWPAGYVYTYITPDYRTAESDVYGSVRQRLTPNYEVYEELLARRIPSCRILDEDEETIVWLDENNAGRHWVDEDRILARLTGWAVDSDNKWVHSWTQVELDSSGDDYVVSGGLSGTTTSNFARNLLEVNNTASGVQGNSVNNAGADYPAGFSLQPIGGGTGGVPGNTVVVWLRNIVTKEGGRAWVFDTPNADDGTCGAP